jgi:hypothetical protein
MLLRRLQNEIERLNAAIAVATDANADDATKPTHEYS